MPPLSQLQSTWARLQAIFDTQCYFRGIQGKVVSTQALIFCDHAALPKTHGGGTFMRLMQITSLDQMIWIVLGGSQPILTESGHQTWTESYYFIKIVSRHLSPTLSMLPLSVKYKTSIEVHKMNKISSSIQFSSHTLLSTPFIPTLLSLNQVARISAWRLTFQSRLGVCNLCT